jgi:hypothetical protein
VIRAFQADHRCRRRSRRTGHRSCGCLRCCRCGPRQPPRQPAVTESVDIRCGYLRCGALSSACCVEAPAGTR